MKPLGVLMPKSVVEILASDGVELKVRGPTSGILHLRDEILASCGVELKCEFRNI